MIRETAAFTLTLMAFLIGPRIRYVPRTIDHAITTRFRLCKGAPDTTGAVRTNEAQLSLAELLGSELVEIQVHQIGEGFGDFDAAADHIRELLTQRPRLLTSYSPWAEPTPLAMQGILGTLQYSENRSGEIEIAGMHACFQDRTGTFWWVRVAAVDVWP
jgi:hypothetical protein